MLGADLSKMSLTSTRLFSGTDQGVIYICKFFEIQLEYFFEIGCCISKMCHHSNGVSVSHGNFDRDDHGMLL